MVASRVDTRPGVRLATRVGIGLALGVVIAVHVAFPDGAAGQASYLGATVGGAVMAVIGLRRRSMPQHWWWLAAAVGLSAAGDGVYAVYLLLLHLPPPELSWGDPLWLLSYVALGLGLSGILGLRAARNPGDGPAVHYRDADALLDMLTAGIVGLLVVWLAVLEPAIGDPETSLGTKAILSVYPVLDVAVVAALVGGMLAVRRRSAAIALTCGGVLCWLLSDFGYAAGSTEVDLTVWLETGWMVGAVLLGMAVIEARPSEPSSAPAPRESAGLWRLAAGFAPLLVPAAIGVWVFGRGDDRQAWAIGLATAALSALAFVRCVRLVHSKDEVVAELDSSERYYRTLAANSSDAVLVLDRSGKIVREPPTLTALGMQHGPLVGMDVTAMPAVVDASLVRELLARAALAPGQLIESELVIDSRREGPRRFAVRVMDMVHDDVIGGVVVNLHDVTDRREMEDELRKQAFHDSLTGLANRALFRDRVGHVLGNRARTGVDPAVVFIDLDDFKYVNDTLGHDAGDQLLRAVADRLLAVVRTGDTVARLGGDEFAVLLGSEDGADHVSGLADRVLEALRAPIGIAGRSLVVSCSIGIARANEHSDTSALLRHADMAMYEAKFGGKGRWALYDPAMGEASQERMDLEGDLHGALEAGELVLVYQPIFEIRSERLSGFEALLRWAHPRIGTIHPDRFIPILEGNGQIVKVGAWALEEACRTATAWAEEPGATAMPLSMSVNVSSVQLASATFVATVADVLARTGFDSTRLVLEITETSLVNDPDTAASRLHDLRGLGVRVAIDDFGTGYSSLSYLHQFPTDILKLDRSFIDSISLEGPMPPLVKGLLDLARTLGIETVAEGIEEEHQLAQLMLARCEKGQGYLFARPLSVENAHRLLREQRGTWVAGPPAPRPALHPGARDILVPPG